MGDRILAIVVPCYKEEAVLGETTVRLTELMKSMIKEKMISGQVLNRSAKI